MIVVEIGKRRRIDAPFAAALVNGVGRLGQHAELVRQRRLFAALQVGLLCRPTGSARGRNRLRPSGKLSNVDAGTPKFLASSGWRRVADPVADAERAELGEVAVVEDEDEVGRLVAEAAEHVAVAAGKVPDVAGFEVVGFGVALGIDDGRSHAAVDHERPFGGGGVPVQLAHHAGFQDHRDAGDALGDRQLLDGRLAADAAADDLADGLFELEFECRQFLAGQERVGDVVVIHGGFVRESGWLPSEVGAGVRV